MHAVETVCGGASVRSNSSAHGSSFTFVLILLSMTLITFNWDVRSDLGGLSFCNFGRHSGLFLGIGFPNRPLHCHGFDFLVALGYSIFVISSLTSFAIGVR